MGKRLEESLGKERCDQLFAQVANGLLKDLRENSLYSQNVEGDFVTPSELANKDNAKELLLLAIEAADDRLIGYTGYTGVIEVRLNELFEEIKNS